MLDKFAEQNAVMRERYADEFIMPEALETAYKTFVKACIDYRVSKPKNGKGETPDFIYSLMNDRLVTLTNLTGLPNKITTTLAREVVIDHFNELAALQASEQNELDRIHY